MERKSFFYKIVNFISTFVLKKRRPLDVEVYSKFKLFLEELPPEDENYEAVSATVELCDEAIKIARQRINLIAKVQSLEEKMKELESISSLSEEDAKNLKSLIDRFLGLTKERSTLIYQLTGFDSSLGKMEKLEVEAQLALPQIQNAEKQRKILKQDIGHLAGEKAELEYERDILQNSLDFINKFAVAMIAIFSLVSMVLVFLYIFQNTQIFLPTSILVLLIIFVVTLLYLFRRRMNFELVMNLKKQKRAVELLNKKNAVLAYYINFLNFEYKKYQIKSSQGLINNLKEYSHYKHVSSRVDNVRKIMYETEAQLERFLRTKKILNVKSDINQFAQTINVDDKINYYRDLEKDKNVLDKNLEELDVRHEKIWDSLVILEEKDRTPNKIIKRIIHSYIDEVSTMLTTLEQSAIEAEEEDQEQELKEEKNA